MQPSSNRLRPCFSVLYAGKNLGCLRKQGFASHIFRVSQGFVYIGYLYSGLHIEGGYFPAAQVLPHDGGDYGGDAMRPAETPRYPGEPRTGAHDPFRNQFSANAREEYEQQQDPGELYHDPSAIHSLPMPVNSTSSSRTPLSFQSRYTMIPFRTSFSDNAREEYEQQQGPCERCDTPLVLNGFHCRLDCALWLICKSHRAPYGLWQVRQSCTA